MRRKSGVLVEHEDGRKGIAYHNDQSNDHLIKNKYVIRFFKDDDITKEPSSELRAVDRNKLKPIGYID